MAQERKKKSTVEEARKLAEGQQSAYVRLHSDENPYGCSLHVQDILGSSDLYHLPADPMCGAWR